MKKRKLRIPAILAAAGVCAALAASTAFAGEWHKDGKVWRYTDDSGRGVNSGWVQDNGSWYYLEPDSTGAGAMKTGWVKDGDTWYYLSPDGAQSTGWQSIGGAWYYFDPAEGGAMAFNRKIGDYYINASGIWAEGSGGVNISAGSGSGKTASSSSTSSSSSSKRRIRRTSDDDDDDDDDYDDDDYDPDDDPDNWDSEFSDDGPGFYMEDLNSADSGPGHNMSSSSGQDYPGAAQKTTSGSSAATAPGQNSYRDVDGSFFDDEEAGGSKDDWNRYSASLYKSQEKDAGDYSGNYGSKYSYETRTITDEDGNTRTIISKERDEDD